MTKCVRTSRAALGMLGMLVMQILFAIAVLSFLALAGAAFAVTRHVRRDAQTEPAMPERERPAKAGPNQRKSRRPGSGERHDRRFAHADAGNLADPEPLRSTRL